MKCIVGRSRGRQRLNLNSTEHSEMSWKVKEGEKVR